MVQGQRSELKDWQFFTENDSIEQLVSIPHTWNSVDAFDDEPGYWQGKGVYTKAIEVSDLTKNHFLFFEGANQHSKVWVNGKFVGEHKGGYTAFHIDISNFLKKGKNTVKIEVDNSHDEQIPPLDADFTFYGGIYRPVFLERESNVHFEKKNGADVVKITPLLNEKLSEGTVKIKAHIKNSAKDSIDLIVSLFDGDDKKTTYTRKLSLVDSLEYEFKISSPKLWSPTSPQLYRLELQLRDGDELVDSYEHKIGFRKFEATPSGFFLNNKALKLIGANRHQDWQGLGNAVPVALQLKDMKMIKEMGSNFLRLAHYPQAKAIYQAADSLGLMLWSEIPVVNKVPVGTDYEAYSRNSLQMQREHIAQNYNHPALVFVGYMNEIFLRMVFDKPEEDEKHNIIANTLELAQELEKFTRKEAPNHTTVMALHGHQIYNDTGIANISMIIGWNLYYGWYEGKIGDLGGFLDQENTKFPNRPLIISEYGVGADLRLHTNTPEVFDFSEEYQLKYHKGYVEQVWQRDFVIGMTAWNFADFGSEFRGDAIPHVNQKGLVNYDRSPKNAYFWYKTILNPTDKQVRIYRDFPVHISASKQKKIKIIANIPTVLKVNDSVHATLTPENGIIETNINLKFGTNTLQVFDDTGTRFDSLDLEWQKPQLHEKGAVLAINLGSHNYFMDANGQLWIPITEVPILNISGEVKNKKTSTNIRNTLDDPLYQTVATGINKLEIQVPNGTYEIKLIWSNLGQSSKLVYELNKGKDDQTSKTKKGTITIQGKEVNFPQIEKFHFVEEKFIVLSKNNKIILSAKDKDSFALSGLLIKRME